MRFPRDWFGPVEELVPFGVASEPVDSHPGPKETGASVVELAPPVPRAEDFWSEGSAAVQDAVQAPEADDAIGGGRAHSTAAPDACRVPIPQSSAGARGDTRPRRHIAALIAVALVGLAVVASALSVATSGPLQTTIHAQAARDKSQSTPAFGMSVLPHVMSRITLHRAVPPHLRRHLGAGHRPRPVPRDAQPKPVITTAESSLGSASSSSARPVAYTTSSPVPRASAPVSTASSAGVTSGSGGTTSGNSSGTVTSSSTPPGPVGPGAPFGPGHLG